MLQPVEAENHDQGAVGNGVHKDGGREQSRSEKAALEELEGVQNQEGKALKDVERLNSEVQGKLGEFGELDKKSRESTGCLRHSSAKRSRGSCERHKQENSCGRTRNEVSE